MDVFKRGKTELLVAGLIRAIYFVFCVVGTYVSHFLVSNWVSLRARKSARKNVVVIVHTLAFGGPDVYSFKLGVKKPKCKGSEKKEPRRTSKTGFKYLTLMATGLALITLIVIIGNYLALGYGCSTKVFEMTLGFPGEVHEKWSSEHANR